MGTQAAALSGIGLSPATDAISPTALSFVAQVVGASSAAQKVTLTNSGDSPLNSIAVSVTGDFSAVDGCGNSLTGNANCAVTVIYVPKQVGPEIGTLTINDMYGRPQTVALAGTGLAPAGISVLPAAINFGPWGIGGTSATQTVTVTNSGGVALNALTFAIAGNFSITADSCSTVLAAGANCSAQIVFSPTQSGPLTGALTITSSSLSNPFQIALSGEGLGFTLQADGASSVTIASGQTATYLLQIVPSAGSSGTLALVCSAAPTNSTCIANPASVQLTSGITATVTVTVATVALTSSSASTTPRRGSSWMAVATPAAVCLLVVPWIRRRRVLLAGALFFAMLPLGCGVNASMGTSTTTSGNSTGTTPLTYNPVVTATGPGITQSVKLTLIVD